MTIQAALDRVAAIRQTLAEPSALIGSGGELAGGVRAPAQSDASSFASVLAQANGSQGTLAPTATQASATGIEGAPVDSALSDSELSPALGSQSEPSLASPYAYSLQGTGSPLLMSPTTLGGTSSSPIVQIAESQIGQSEQPPGSNEGPAIAAYRGATVGAIPGAPWCAYFASWAARQAGEPIGPQGEGLGSVSEIWSWAQSAGRAIPNGPGVTPKPGDLIVFGSEHVGIVKDVLPDGQIQTIEGNYENKVAANVRTPTEATGYVEMS